MTRIKTVVAGVDTHKDTHHAAVIDTAGRQIADASFPTTKKGYVELSAFVSSFGELVRVGVEGTGSYGAALTRHLQEQGIEIVEVIRPNRQVRRMKGKSDPIDAYAAARTALTEPDAPTPKDGTGPAEQIRYLLVARRRAVKARTSALIQIKTLLITAPDVLRSRLREMSENTLILTLSRLRPDAEDPIRYVLKSLAKRHIHLTAEITDLEVMLTPLVTSTNPGLAATKGLGAITAAQLLVTAGDNPDRLRSEAAFAALCGVSPIPASSGKTTRHRLNRGGDRQANAALHRIVLVRMSYEPRTRDYVARKRAQGHSTKEIIRCLKRAVAREVFTLLTKQVDVPRVDDLRPLRQARGITLTAAAHHFEIWPTILSDVERGLRRHDDLVTAYRQWLTAA